jgi:hypothetical protein
MSYSYTCDYKFLLRIRIHYDDMNIGHGIYYCLCYLIYTHAHVVNRKNSINI